jgi:CsoR family transcriptional regulator, copper-sensing transcriptional repressor
MSRSPTESRPGAAAGPEACTMAVLKDDKSRTDLLHRLKRAEGQLRGIQRMIEQGEDCLSIASQMSAVRKALDSAYVRMTVCFVEQELGARLGDRASDREDLGHMLENMETLLGKIR